MSAKKVASLEKQMANLRVAVANKNAAATPSSSKSTKGGKKKKRAAINPGGGAIASFTISHTELLVTSVSTNDSGVGKGNVELQPKSFTVANKFAALMERYKFNKLVIEYRPLVGSTVGGAVSFGIDWNATLVDKDRAQISGLSPNVSCAVAATTKLNLPVSQLQARKWLVLTGTSDSVDTKVGRLLFAVTGDKNKSMGEFWVHYIVEMQGLNIAA